MRKLRRILLGSLIAFAVAPAALAQGDYPNQRVTIVVPFSAGSITDGLARVLADRLGDMWKQQVIVENRPGIAGTASVARSAPDGYTLMLTSNGHTIGAVVNKNLPYDPAKDFAGVTEVASVPQALIVPPDLPAKNGTEFVALAKASPGKMNFSSAGARQHVLSRRGAFEADRQDRHHARAQQGCTRGGDERDAQRFPAVLPRRQSRDRAEAGGQDQGYRGVDA